MARGEAAPFVRGGATCGPFWTGARDEAGIPHSTMGDGSPNGYSVMSVDENEYSFRYKAARRPADYQMTITAPEVVAATQAGATEIVVNVFAASKRCDRRDAPWRGYGGRDGARRN